MGFFRYKHVSSYGVVTFLLAQKSNQKRALCPMLPPTYPARPSLGKEANALFFWLVLRTTPYELIFNSLNFYNSIIHVIILIFGTDSYPYMCRAFL